MLKFLKRKSNQRVRMPAQISPSVRCRNTENCGFFPAMAALPATFRDRLNTILATDSVIIPNT